MCDYPQSHRYLILLRAQLDHFKRRLRSTATVMTIPGSQIANGDLYDLDKSPSYKYVFRNPFASRIHRITTPDESLSILHQINESQRSDRRLPAEISLRINKEVQRNATVEEIRNTWSPVPAPNERSFALGSFGYLKSPLRAQLDTSARKYIPLEIMGFDRRGLPYFSDNSIEAMLYSHVSSADILYRLRCYFPEIIIDSNLDEYKSVWEGYLRHNQTGMLLLFFDYKGGAWLKVHYDEQSKYQRALDNDTQKEIEEAFSSDGIKLLNSLFGTQDGSRRLLFYHPSADADVPTDNERYIAVPVNYALPRCHKRFNPSIYERWHSTEVSDSDLLSFRSILQDLKYDIPSRKIDRLNGTSDLTTVISSPLLFYRLICKFMLKRTHVNVNRVTPITSVWQIKLVHETKGASIIFMDSYGVFDIRADEKAEEMMNDVAVLVEALCSNGCSHPYDSVLAGCVA